MAKKFNVKGDVVEENEFYKVIKDKDNARFYVFSKYDDTSILLANIKLLVLRF